MSSTQSNDQYKVALDEFKSKNKLMNSDIGSHESWVSGATIEMPDELHDFFYELETTAETLVNVAELGSYCALPDADQETVQHYKEAINF